MSEQVMVFSASFLYELLAYEKFENGFCHNGIECCHYIFNNSDVHFMDRQAAEINPEFKQIIPYVICRYGDKFLAYERTKKGNEDRLHNLMSLGIGGHINPVDGLNGPYADATFYSAMQREIKEEINIDNTYWDLILKGCIYDDSTSVGCVHFGIVFYLYTDSAFVQSLDPSIGSPAFYEADELIAMRDKFEAWSQIVIDNLIKV